MDRNKTKIYCLFAVSIILMLFGAVSYFISFTKDFDADIGHFAAGSVFAPIMYVCMAAGALCGVAAWILFARRGTGDHITVGEPVSHIAVCAVCTVAIFADAIADLVEYLRNGYTTAGAPAAIHYLFWVLGLVSGACMLVCALPKSYSIAERALAGFAAPLFLADKIMIQYFDTRIAVNSPAKLGPQVALICIMLALTAEVGLNVQRKHIFPRWLFTLCATVAVSGTVGIGMLAVIASGGTVPGENIFDALLITAFAARSAVKLFFAKDAELEIVEKTKKDEKTLTE